MNDVVVYRVKQSVEVTTESRDSHGDWWLHPDKPVVLYTDFAALQQQLERLQTSYSVVIEGANQFQQQLEQAQQEQRTLVLYNNHVTDRAEQAEARVRELEDELRNRTTP